MIFFFFICRTWHLSVIQREEKMEQAIRPQRKTVIEHPQRGGIYDRFGIPLAINKIKYNATVYYAQFRTIPITSYDASLQKKTFPRKEYIKNLSSLLGNILEMDPDRIEDIIYAKASMFPHSPTAIKENIDEKTYYKLRMLERDWVGLHADIDFLRYYPQNKSASSIVGYMGAISQHEFLSIAHELQYLQEIIDEKISLPPAFSSMEEVLEKYTVLKTKSYSIHDLVGKWGLEGKCEKILRGTPGKKTFSIDNKGNFLQQLPDAILAKSGTPVFSSISAELQLYAEQLLAQEEKERIGKSRIYDPQDKKSVVLPQPFIKGGAIVALDPSTGEIIALASHPRFNPNDFISSSKTCEQQKKIHQWLETSQHIGEIFDGQKPLSREFFLHDFYEEDHMLSWDFFLQSILPQDSPLYSLLQKISVGDAITLQEAFDDILYYAGHIPAKDLINALFPLCEGHIPITTSKENLFFFDPKKSSEILLRKKKILPLLKNIPSNYDKLFTIDLCRMALNSALFSNDLIEKTKNISLSMYWDLTKAYLRIEKKVQDTIFPFFIEHHFKKWVQTEQTTYIRKKRNQEKQRKTYAHPYIDYLDQKQKKQFQKFWQEHNNNLLYAYVYSSSKTSPSDPLTEFVARCNPDDPDAALLKSYISDLSYPLMEDLFHTFRSFAKLDRPLLTSYPRMKSSTPPTEQTLAASFYPRGGLSYIRSYCFHHATPLGSLFKPITAYAGLLEKYRFLRNNNLPLTDLNPLTITDCYRWDAHATKKGSYVVGYSLNNKPFTRFYKGGRLPRSSNPEIGTIDLIGALGHSSNPYFSLLASECLSSPGVLLDIAQDFGFGEKTNIDLYGEYKGSLPTDLEYNKTGLYSFAIGQHSLVTTPLQIGMALASLVNGGKLFFPKIYKDDQPPKVKRTIFLPPEVAEIIIQGMGKTLWSSYGTARPAIINKLKKDPSLKSLFLSLEHQLIGKTGTAEIMFSPSMLPSSSPYKYKHIWFGSISFDHKKPDLVVIVYLPFGSSGKEAAPLAAQIIHRYRTIKKTHLEELQSDQTDP
ncbi:MAG: hypothetical protein JW769_00010 [Parachlamydiales bacterium]|nr:hypothetical protein [Parachlamydiales bacterium]